MLCSDCYDCLPLLQCTGEVTIGTAPAADTAYKLVFEHTSGRRDMVDITSGASSELVLDLSEASFTLRQGSYTLWLASASNLFDQLALTVDAQTGKTCARFEVESVNQGSEKVSENQTLKIAP